MREAQLRRVQRLPLKSIQCLDQRRRRALRQPLAATVHRITDDGIADVREMNPYLVRAPGLQPHARQRVRAKLLFDPVVGHGLAPVAAHGHLDALRAVPADGLIDGPAAGHHAGAHGEVLALDLVRGQSTSQRGVRLERARHD
jgi:hypothetical protein